jgi:tetratricopeptide (TPR) repeat protein
VKHARAVAGDLAVEHESAEALLALANCETRLGDHRGAMERLQRAAELAPGDHEIGTALGVAALEAGEFEVAEEALGAATDSKPSEARGWDLLGTALAARGSFTKLKGTLGRSLALAPDSVSNWFSLGTLELGEGDLEEAERCFLKALALDAGFARAWNNLGVARARAGRYEQALDAFRRAAAASQQWAEARTNVALAEWRLGRSDEALATLDRVSRDLPRAAATHRIRACMLIERGKAREALAELRIALELDPEDAAACHFSGVATLLDAGVRPGALEALPSVSSADPEAVEGATSFFDRALELRPGDADAMVTWAELLLGSDDATARELAAEAEKSAAGGRAAARARIVLARLSLAEGDLEQAIANAETSLRHHESEPGMELLARLRACSGRDGEASALARRLADLFPESPRAWCALAVASSQDAEESLRRALSLDPAQEEAAVGLATLLSRRGSSPESLKTLTRATELAKGSGRECAALAAASVSIGLETTVSLDVISSRETAGDGEAGVAEEAIRLLGEARRGGKLHPAWEMRFAVLEARAECVAGRPADALSRLDSAGPPEPIAFYWPPSPSVEDLLELSVADLELAKAEALASPGLGRREEALALIDSLLEGDPSRWDAWRLRTVLLVEAERFADAAEALRRAWELRPFDFPRVAALVELFALAGAHDRALEFAEKLVALRPDDARGWTLLANLAVRAGDAPRATVAARTAVNCDETHAPAWNALGLARLAARDHAGALASFEKAMAAEPLYGPALLNHGTALLESGRGYPALEKLAMALKLMPARAEVHVAIAKAHLYLGEPEKAFESLAVAPATVEVSRLRGYAAVEARKIEDAEKALEDVETRAPGDARTLYLKALVEEARGGDAGPLLEKVLQVEPGHAGARRRLAQEASR